MIKRPDHEYYMWLRHLVSKPPMKDFNYNSLLKVLYEREYIPDNRYDHNRMVDGLYLREKYARHTTKTDEEYDKLIAYIDASFGRNPCSMLEMMIGLAYRHDKRYGDDLDLYNLFWFMVDSLGLNTERDDVIDYERVNKVIDDFLDRRYRPDGAGSLFYVPSTTKDMRDLEIWYQAQEFYNSLPEDDMFDD